MALLLFGERTMEMKVDTQPSQPPPTTPEPEEEPGYGHGV